ncbi:MAG: hypothetical protein ACKVOR_01885 [Flavobacteriales bacterium]
MENPLVLGSGAYGGQWQNDTSVAMVSLNLNPDGSYSLTQMLVDNKALSLDVNPEAQLSVRKTTEQRGTFTCDANANDFMLHPSDNSSPIYLRKQDNSLVRMDQNNEPMLYNYMRQVLDRITKPTAINNGYIVNYQVKPFSMSYPVQVFLRTAGNHFNIHKTYLDAAPEAERALAAYYAMKFNSGCEDKGCTLTNALGMNDQTANDAISKWLGSVPEAAGLVNNVSAPESRIRLTFLFFVKTATGVRADYTLLDANDSNLRGSDEFALQGDSWKLTKQTAPAVVNR